MSFAEIEKAIVELKEQEVEFKKLLERMVYDPSHDVLISVDQRVKAEEYLSRNWDYFRNKKYLQESLDRLNECLQLFSFVCNEKLFQRKADVLKTQLELVGVPA
jgi:hypothetical protein